MSVAFLSPWATYTQFGLFLTPITLAGMALLIVYCADRIVSSDYVVSQVGFQLAIFSVYLLLGAVWAIDPKVWLNSIAWWIVCFAVFVGARRFIVTRKHFFALMICMAAGMVPTYSLLTVAEYTYTSSDRLGVPGHNSNFTAYIVAGTVMLMLTPFRILKMTQVSRIILIPALLLAFLLLYRLGTRGAEISALGVIAFCIFGRLLPLWALKTVVIGIFLFCLAITFGLLDWLIVAIDLLSDRSTGDLSGRGNLWKLAIEKFQSSPFLGSGLGAASKLGTEEVGAHNFFLVILVDTGLIGSLLFMAFIRSFAKKLLKNTVNGGRILMYFAVYWFPIATSGHWELSPFSWLVVGLTLQLGQISLNSANKNERATEPMVRPLQPNFSLIKEPSSA